MKVLLVVALLAVAIYLTVRAIERRGGLPRSPGSPGSQRPRRPRGPDDDPDFLRGLGNDKP